VCGRLTGGYSDGDSEPVADEQEMAKALLALGSATLGESGGRPMRPRIKPAWPGARLAAPAVPVRCSPGDNLAIHVAVANAPTGSVLVVDVGDVAERGYWGEVLTTGAESRGLAGLVIDGGVRDIEAIAAHGFPVFSSTIALRGASKEQAGTVGLPVAVGGAPVRLGDWIVGDYDGVTVVPAGFLDEVLAAGRAREAKEKTMFEKLKAGSTTVELLNLDPAPVDITALQL
jgi:4-hydroxy-4-methyl-2-oxoglutarate aldolase